MTQTIHPTLALIDSNIQELQQLILEFEALAFPTEETLAPSPSVQPIRIKMRAGKGYNALAKRINQRMQDHPDWQHLSGQKLRERMGGQMLFQDHVYVFEAENLLSNDPISGGLNPSMLTRAKKAGEEWRNGGRERWLAQQTTDVVSNPTHDSFVEPSTSSILQTPHQTSPTCDIELSDPTNKNHPVGHHPHTQPTSDNSTDCTIAVKEKLNSPPQKIMTSQHLDVWMSITGTLSIQKISDCSHGEVDRSGYTLDLGPVQDQLIAGWSIKRMRSGEIALQHHIAGEWVSSKLELIGLEAIKFTLSSLVGEWEIDQSLVKANLGGFVVIRRKSSEQNTPDRTPTTHWSVDQILEWTRKGWRSFQQVIEDLPVPEPVATPNIQIPDIGFSSGKDRSWWDEHEDKIQGIGLLVGAGALVTGTLVEDVVTGGAGIADDPASFAAAAAMASAGISAF